MQQSKKDIAIRVDPRSVTYGLLLAGAFVICLGVGREIVVAMIGTDTVLQDLRHFALDSERSLPAFYSSLLLLGASALLFAMSILVRQRGKPDAGRWLLLAVIFIAMSIDEAVSFHEVLIEPLRERFNLGGLLYFSWVIPGTAAVLALGLYFLPFLLRLPRSTAMLLMGAGAIYVGGALGLELVGGVLAERHDMQAPVYLSVAVAEESMEIAGITLFIATLLATLRSWFPAASLGFAGAHHSQPARSTDRWHDTRTRPNASVRKPAKHGAAPVAGRWLFANTPR